MDYHVEKFSRNYPLNFVGQNLKIVSRSTNFAFWSTTNKFFCSLSNNFCSLSNNFCSSINNFCRKVEKVLVEKESIFGSIILLQSFYPSPPWNHPSQTKFPPPPAKFPPPPIIAPALSSSFSNFNFRSLWDLIHGPLSLQSSLLTTWPILPTEFD